MTQLEPACCRLCRQPLEHHGTVCNRCWKVRRNNTPQANAAADLAAHWPDQWRGLDQPDVQSSVRSKLPDRASSIPVGGAKPTVKSPPVARTGPRPLEEWMPQKMADTRNLERAGPAAVDAA